MNKYAFDINPGVNKLSNTNIIKNIWQKNVSTDFKFFYILWNKLWIKWQLFDYFNYLFLNVNINIKCVSVVQ